MYIVFKCYHCDIKIPMEVPGTIETDCHDCGREIYHVVETY